MHSAAKHFGHDTGKIRVRFHNGTEIVKGHIVKQLGVCRYKVSDGRGEHVIQLAQTLAEATHLTPGLGTIRVYGNADAAASFAVTYRLRGVTVADGGTGYAAGDTLVLGGDGPAATLKVDGVDENGAVAAVVVVARGDYPALPGTVRGAARVIAAEGGGGSGLTVAATFEVASAQVTEGGRGFRVGDKIKAASDGGLAQPVFIVGKVDEQGAVISATVRAAGNFAAPVTFGTNTGYDHVKRLGDRVCLTVSGKTLDWHDDAVLDRL